MLHAITHRPSPRLEECELTYRGAEPIDLERAEAQHRAYRDLLHRCGARVRVLDGNLEMPDSVFVEDTAVVLDELAVVTPMGTASRRGEVEQIAAELEKYRPVARLDDPSAALEGGDILRVGRQLFVGLGTRTNDAGVASLRALVEPLGYTVHPVHVPGCLHLKTGVTALDPETVLLNDAWVDPEPFADFRRIPVADDEPFAANTLRLGDTICMPASFPRTRRRVEAAGFQVETVAIGEFLKAEAGLTCMSLVFEA